MSWFARLLGRDDADTPGSEISVEALLRPVFDGQPELQVGWVAADGSGVWRRPT
jgi:hypothetical protein